MKSLANGILFPEFTSYCGAFLKMLQAIAKRLETHSVIGYFLLLYSTGETRHITHHIDCYSKNVIYMLHCNRCHKKYIGETKRRLKDRFNQHRRPVDKQTNSSNPPQSQNIFFLTTITLLTCSLFLSNSSNLIVTVCAKISSTEVKLLNA